MNRIQLRQNADFLSIALESLEANSDEVAAEFIEDVADSIEHSDREDRLRDALSALDDGDLDTAEDLVMTVHTEVVDDVDDL